jgi:cell division septation protein DedD
VNRLQIAILLLPALLAVGCSREAEDWRSAQAADTPESYAQFLKQHADSAQAATANTRMEQLAEERDWQMASAEDSAAAYQNFVVRHPEGKWAQEARIRVENFALNESVTGSTAGAPPLAEVASEEPVASVAVTAGPHPPNPPRPPVAAAPRPAPAPAPAPRPAAVATSPASGFGVQLGAFSSEAGAQAQWKSLAAKYRNELAGQSHRVSPRRSGSSQIYRLQVARASEQQARELCARLKAKGQGCVVVLP